MIDWNAIPKEIVAIDMYSDCSGANALILNDELGLIRIDDDPKDLIGIDVLIAVRPESSVIIAKTLTKIISKLEGEVYKLKKENELSQKRINQLENIQGGLE